jgi:hypothetical protein
MLFTPQSAAAPGPVPLAGDGLTAGQHESLSTEPRDADADDEDEDEDEGDRDGTGEQDSTIQDGAHEAAPAQGLK